MQLTQNEARGLAALLKYEQVDIAMWTKGINYELKHGIPPSDKWSTKDVKQEKERIMLHEKNKRLKGRKEAPPSRSEEEELAPNQLKQMRRLRHAGRTAFQNLNRYSDYYEHLEGMHQKLEEQARFKRIQRGDFVLKNKDAILS